jgi:Autographiviridae endonuclease VII
VKKCSKCGLEKSLVDFSKDKHTRDGKRGSCRDCNSQYWKAWRAANKEIHQKRARDWAIQNPKKRRRSGKNCELKKLYGISLVQYEQMIEQQGGKCKICDSLMPIPCVDHCHETGKIRGLLCPRCNGGLGQFGDSRTLLYRAAGYLANFSDNFTGDAGC